MTKKHFDELAKIITEAQEYINDADLYKIANRIADYCSTQSHTFDRERFLKACGFKDYQCGCEKNIFTCLDCYKKQKEHTCKECEKTNGMMCDKHNLLHS